MKNNILLLYVLIFCSGCASTSTFRPYTFQINPLIEDIKDNRSIDLKKSFGKKINSQDKVLYLLEQGRIAQINGDIRISKDSFAQAEQALRQMDDKAIFSASGAIGQVGEMLVNDNALPYRAEGYERVMLFHYQAFNYLYENDIEGAAVEIRKANMEQEKALNRHLGEIERSKILAQNNRISDQTPDSVNNVYGRLDGVIGNLKDSFQNAYTFYLSGIIYEMIGQPNDAYIDYKKASEIFPDNRYLQKDVQRLAKKLSMQEDLNYFKNLFNPLEESLVDLGSKNTGELIVLFEDDFIPQKEQVKIPVPVSLENLNFIAVAFPMYNVDRIDLWPLLLYENGQVLARSEPICNLSSIALKALKEKVSSLVVHQLVRIITKTLMVHQAQREFGDLGGVVVSAYNVLSENADLRSWATLPATVQIMRLSVTFGEHEFAFLQKETGANVYVKVNIKENSKKIIRFVRAGNKIYYLNLT